MPYMQLRRGKGNCGGDAELICLVKGRSHVLVGRATSQAFTHSPRGNWLKDREGEDEKERNTEKVLGVQR